jgi:hypothetical protein
MRVARWFDSTEQPADLRPKVLGGVEAIARELPRRADWFEVVTVALDDSADMPIRVDGQRYRAFPCGNRLAVSSVVPGWGFGWSKVFRDDEVYQILSWFLRYAAQYIHRSDVASVLMVVWDEHGKSLHPSGSNVMGQRYGPVIPMTPVRNMLDSAKQRALEAWGDDGHSSEGASTVSNWISKNLLDPFLHQAVFHFLRGQKLKAQEFNIEAVVAFDCVMQSIAGFIRARRHLGTELTRGQVCEQLCLPSKSAELADYAYFLRNNFGAHAGGWRWWDQAEVLDEEDLSEIALLAKTVLSKTADLEPQMRLVEPFPAQWGNWLFENFEMLWEVLWFEKLARWNKK